MHAVNKVQYPKYSLKENETQTAEKYLDNEINYASEMRLVDC